MSGRTHHWRDGKLITNRKTDRRQSPRRRPENQFPDIRLTCALPKTLAFAVAPGVHGYGVEVLNGGVAQIIGNSAEHCFLLARAFFAKVATERPGFTVTASIVSTEKPDKWDSRHLTIVRGAMVVSGGNVEPKVFEAA